MFAKLVLPFTFIASLFVGTPDHTTKLVDKTTASIVHIVGVADFNTFMGPMRGTYSCTGIVVAEDRVLTARHCLGDEMTADGEKVEAVLRQSNEVDDLALIMVETNDKPLLKLGKNPDRFETVIAVGYGFGFNRPTVTIAKVLFVDYTPYKDHRMSAGLWVDRPYHGGMSGGPVVNEGGKLVGIVQQSNDGIGYGVGVGLIRTFLGDVVRP